jgi:hypothetical protein
MSELSRTLSRRQLQDELTEWMVEEFGNPKDLPPLEQDKWHERNGFANHFFRHLIKEV